MSEIAVYQPRGEVAAREPHRDIDSWIQVVSDVIKIANVICDTPFVPDGLRGSAPAVAAAILSGREMGLGMMTSLANIDVIRGKPTQKPLLMRAMILERGHKWIDVDVTDTRAVVRGCRKGESEWTEVSFTADQARKAGLDLGKYPADKLYARASSRLAKRRFADVIMGMPYTPDDVEDGVADEEIGTVTESAALPAAAEPPKPRTAQRASRRPAAAAPASDSAQAPQKPQAPAPASAQTAPPADLPLLPGEDEPGPTAAPPQGTASPPSTSAPGDRDAHGTANRPQLTRIWATLTGDMGYPHADKDAARAACAAIAGRDLETSSDLSYSEAGTVIDTLGLALEVARRRGGEPRAILEGLARDPRAAALAELARLGVTGAEAVCDTAGAALRVTPPASLESLERAQAVRLAGMLACCADRPALDVMLRTGEVPGDA